MSTARDTGGGDLAALFAAAPRFFPTSPLYSRLGRVVAGDESLLALARQARAGQLPQNLLFAAVHYLLLAEPDDPLAAWYPSLGGTAAGDPGPAFTAFCRRRSADIADLMRHRLVQANVVKRAAALRLGMAVVASEARGPVTFVEVGSSAGVHLRFDAYRYDVGGRVWGEASSRVLVPVEWRGTEPPVLGPLPRIRERVGIDLCPIDATDPEERRWLRALVWPENVAQAALLDEALAVVAAAPPRVVAGDMAEVLPRVVSEVPYGTAVVVFHSATRLHVAAGDRAAFDAAVAGVARDHELFHLSYEASEEESRAAGEPVFALELRRGAGRGRTLAIGDGHGEWLSGPV